MGTGEVRNEQPGLGCASAESPREARNCRGFPIDPLIGQPAQGAPLQAGGKAVAQGKPALPASDTDAAARPPSSPEASGGAGHGPGSVNTGGLTTQHAAKAWILSKLGLVS